MALEVVGSSPTTHPTFFCCSCRDVGVSPSGKARDFDSRIRKVRILPPQPFYPLAQLVEHLTFNQGVPRSSRGWITNYGPLVKRSRHRPFTAVTGVRFPYGSPIPGTIAQLGEHLPYKQGVTGSSPVSPTNYINAAW